jgi:predicted amidohydrolase
MSSLHITLLQSPLHWENPEANLNMFTQKIESLPGKKELVVLPEMFNTGFSLAPDRLAETMDGPTVQWMRDMSIKHRIILTGSLIIREDEHAYNRLVWMQPNGQCGTYDKRHLFSYGGENEGFSAGSKRLITQANGMRICTNICYDLRFPVWNRQTNPDEYDLLLYVANWPEKRIHAWKTLLQARAIENQCYVIGINRTGTDGNGHQYCGESSIIGPLGEVLLSSTQEHDILQWELERKTIQDIRQQLPFQQDKDGFILS